MAETEKPSKKPKPPKGGRKGGTLFPKLNLKETLEYAEKLVSYWGATRVHHPARCVWKCRNNRTSACVSAQAIRSARRGC